MVHKTYLYSLGPTAAVLVLTGRQVRLSAEGGCSATSVVILFGTVWEKSVVVDRSSLVAMLLKKICEFCSGTATSHGDGRGAQCIWRLLESLLLLDIAGGVCLAAMASRIVFSSRG